MREPTGGTEEPNGDTRAALAEQLIREMAGWSARDRFGAFRKWHRGALSLIHLNVLTVLEAEGPQPMHRLAELLDVSDASATGIVDRMERRGLVERRHATDDRRMVVVHPAPAAEDVFREMQEHRFDHLRRMMLQLDEEELAGLLVGIRGLQRARAALGPSPEHIEHETDGTDTNGTAADDPAATEDDTRTDR